MPRIETLTLNEMINLFRDYGIPFSYEKAVAMIMQEKLPFAIGVAMPSGNNQFTIFKRSCLNWLKERSEE